MRKQLMQIGVAVLFFLQAGRLGVTDAYAGDQPQSPPATQPAKAVLAVANHPGIEVRDPKADRRLIDLTSYYTLALTEDASGVYGYTLDALPRGVQQIANVHYDLRGIVQVSSQVNCAGRIFPRPSRELRSDSNVEKA